MKDRWTFLLLAAGLFGFQACPGTAARGNELTPKSQGTEIGAAAWLPDLLAFADGRLAPTPVAVNRVWGGDPAQPLWSPKAAAKYLDGHSDEWLNWSGAARGQQTVCLSCHTSLPFALARPALGNQLGETSAGDVEKRLIDNVRKRVSNWEKIVTTSTTDKTPFVPYYAKERKMPSLGTESVLNALVLVRFDGSREMGKMNASTKKALVYMWEQQQDNGAWLWLDFGLKPWEMDSASYFGASLAAVAVGTAGKDYSENAEIQPKLALLRKHLQTQFANQPLHHRVMGLWASSKLPGILTEPDKKKLIEEILSVQEADGGWSLLKLGKKASGAGEWKGHGAFPEGTVADGYATGLVVLALKRAGMTADNPKLKKAIGWLASKQQDGTWPANYINRPREPQTNVGMFLRDAATAYAILALAEPD